jgi:predicted sugar kinase
VWCQEPNAHGALGALAAAAGRGKRSNIGLAGFLSGGLIVDRGQSPDSENTAFDSGRLERTHAFAFPSEWRLLLVRDPSGQGDSGEAETQMFRHCSHRPNPHRAEMLRLIDDSLVPGLQSQDWHRVSAALGNYGQLAGEIFRPVQGGIYRSPAIAHIVDQLRLLGLPGCGQCSWGPTVYGLAIDKDQASYCAGAIQRALPHVQVEIVAPRNIPAIIDRA